MSLGNFPLSDAHSDKCEDVLHLGLVKLQRATFGSGMLFPRQGL